MPRKPAHPTPTALKPRLVAPGSEIAYTARDGSQRVLRADDAGSITPETPADAEVIDGFAIEQPVTGEEG